MKTVVYSTHLIVNQVASAAGQGQMAAAKNLECYNYNLKLNPNSVVHLTTKIWPCIGLMDQSCLHWN